MIPRAKGINRNMAVPVILICVGGGTAVLTTLGIVFGPRVGPSNPEQRPGRLSSRPVYIPWYAGPLAFLIRYLGVAALLAGLIWLLVG